MHQTAPSSRPQAPKARPSSWAAYWLAFWPASHFARAGLGVLAAMALAGLGYGLLNAQVSGERGIAPTAASSDIEVSGIKVDESGKSAAEARRKGWETARRIAWKRAGGPAISDAQLDQLVSGIVIENEQIGPTRYVASLGVIFDRQRAARFLGGASSARSSAPMLLLPVTASAGVYTVFETRNAWQRAWAQFNPGTSRIDYVRPSGAGGDSLLLNFGQVGRRSRVWWRSSLDQYGAADVLIAIARLEHQFPGGPIKGTFIARYGPDNTLLDTFTMEAPGDEALAPMLREAVARMDALFEAALEEGKLLPDPTLTIAASGGLDPALQRLIQIGRALTAREAAEREAEAAGEVAGAPQIEAQPTIETAETPAAATTITVQFASPDASAFDASLSAVRGVPGVSAVAVTSTAMGGTSVMRATFTGDVSGLAAALRARGFSVREGADALAISREP